MLMYQVALITGVDQYYRFDDDDMICFKDLFNTMTAMLVFVVNRESRDARGTSFPFHKKVWPVFVS